MVRYQADLFRFRRDCGERLAWACAELSRGRAVAVNCLAGYDLDAVAQLAFDQLLRFSFASMPEHRTAISWIEQSATLCKQGDRVAAAAALREAIAIEPGVAAWHCDLAVLCQTTGQLDEAAAAYRRAVECDSSFRQAWYNLGCLLNEQDREAEALDCFHQAVRLAPDHAAAHHNLAQSLFNLGNTDEAIAHYRRAVAVGGGTKPETMLALSIAVSPTATAREVLETRRNWSRGNFPPPPQQSAPPLDIAPPPLAVSRVDSSERNCAWATSPPTSTIRTG